MIKRILKLISILLIVIALFFGGLNVYEYFKYEKDYINAIQLLDKDDYEGYQRALELLEGLGDYENSKKILEKAVEALYESTRVDILSYGRRDISKVDKIIEAVKRLELIPDYKDSNEMIRDNKNFIYDEALYLFGNENFAEALILFRYIPDYRRSNDMIQELEGKIFPAALEAYENNRIDDALYMLKSISDYIGAEELLEEIEVLDEKYNRIITLSSSGYYEDAILIAEELEGYRDSSYITRYLRAKSIYKTGALTTLEKQQGIIENIYYLSLKDFTSTDIKEDFLLFIESIKDIEVEYILAKLVEEDERTNVDNFDRIIEDIYHKYGVSIKYNKEDMLKDSYCEMTHLQNNEHIYSLVDVIRKGIKRYPISMIRGKVKNIYLAKNLYMINNKVKKDVSGMASSDKNSIAIKYADNNAWNEDTFHHELAHLLYYSAEDKFPKEKWISLNPPNHTYMKDTFDILNNPDYASGIDYAYMKKGFISSYASTTLEEDMAELSAGIFTSGMNLLATIENYPILHEKYKLLMEFYNTMDSIINDEYLKAISKH